MSKSKFKDYNEEAITYRYGESKHRLQCCDCGLVHDVNMFVRSDEAVMIIRRNNKSTAQVRRYKTDVRIAEYTEEHAEFLKAIKRWKEHPNNENDEMCFTTLRNYLDSLI